MNYQLFKRPEAMTILVLEVTCDNRNSVFFLMAGTFPVENA